MKDKNNKNNNKIKSRRGTSGFWREIAAPIFILILIPALCVWNGRKIAHDTQRWIDQIQTVENLSRRNNFNAAFLTLSNSYQDWLKARTYLHIVCRHDAVDNAEELYNRCLYLAENNNNNNINAFLSELSGLRGQLKELSQTEKFSIENIL